LRVRVLPPGAASGVWISFGGLGVAREPKWKRGRSHADRAACQSGSNRKASGTAIAGLDRSEYPASAAEGLRPAAGYQAQELLRAIDSR